MSNLKKIELTSRRVRTEEKKTEKEQTGIIKPKQ